MKTLLFTVLLAELAFLFFIGGRLYEINRHVKAAHLCFEQMDKNPNIDKYYKHSVDIQTVFPHAEAHSYMLFYSCVNKEL